MPEALSTPSSPPAETASLAMQISTIFDSLVEALHHALPAAGYPDIRPTHSVNLFRVIDSDGTRPSELARRAGVTAPAMAEIVRYLESGGYVERVADPTDGRARIVRLTDRGLDACAVAERVFADVEQGWERKLGERRMVQFRQMLAELTRS